MIHLKFYSQPLLFSYLLWYSLQSSSNLPFTFSIVFFLISFFFHIFILRLYNAFFVVIISIFYLFFFNYIFTPPTTFNFSFAITSIYPHVYFLKRPFFVTKMVLALSLLFVYFPATAPQCFSFSIFALIPQKNERIILRNFFVDLFILSWNSSFSSSVTVSVGVYAFTSVVLTI